MLTDSIARHPTPTSIIHLPVLMQPMAAGKSMATVTDMADTINPKSS
jgi:hypothetical protein